MGLSLGLHASRQLSGKVLRYLKRVIVTPAVYRPFFRLCPAFRYRHWAGFSGNTHPFGLAATYVFIKQSEPPGHCDQPFAWLAPLLPRVRGQLAEFPRPDYADSPRASHPGAPVLVLGTDPQAGPNALFTGTRDEPKRTYALPITFSPPSRRYGPLGASTLERSGYHARPAPMRPALGRDL